MRLIISIILLRKQVQAWRDFKFIHIVVQPVSLVLSYNYKFDKENELLGAIAANTSQTIGIQISL